MVAPAFQPQCLRNMFINISSPGISAKVLRRQHFWQVWLAGCLMAAPLSIPLVSLVIPVLGVATFTHFFQRVIGQPLPRR